MYNNNDVAQRIKAIAKEKGITIKALLDKCGLNINYLSEYAKGQDMSTKNFFKICDCLGVSADYLLGRTEQGNNIMEIGIDNEVSCINSNSNNINTIGQRNKVTCTNEVTDTSNKIICNDLDEETLIRYFRCLEDSAKSDVIKLVIEMKSNPSYVNETQSK